MTICFYTFGCKLNQAETENLEEKLKEKGWIVLKNRDKADVYLINSCVVTQKAAREVRQKIHQVRRKNPKSFLGVIGCFTLDMKEKESKNVDFWVKNENKDNLDQKLDEIFREKREKERLNKSQQKFSLLNERTRSLIKIQSGCLNYCSYCIVPLVRKRIVNRPSQDIIYEILRRQKQGFKEVVLVGTNISTYFCPNSKITLTGLLEKILVETSIERIRLSSFWPTHLEKKLINLIAEQPRLCNHLHLSIQSASNSVLKQMNRNYTEEDLDKIISQLKKNKDLNLSADFIVGFPGETNLDFKKTKKLVKRAKFLKIHVFRFSKRPGTKAEQMKESISEKEKQKRSKALITVGDKISRKRRKYFINQSRMVLFESKRQGYWQGFTENYLKVFVENKNNLKNQIIRVKLKKVFKDGIIGQINAF